MIKNLRNRKINIRENTYISDTAKIIGSVNIKSKSSIWYGAVVRGDSSLITIGENTNIQDNTVIHSENINELYIGDNVTIGHNCIIHCNQIKGNSLIGMGSILMNGVVIGKNSIIGSGSLVTKNKHIGEGELWMGSPAKYIRNLTEKEIESIMISANDYYELSKIHKEE